MSEPITREDVIRKIGLANDNLNESDNTYSHDPEERLIRATQALAQAQLATAYATLLVAENQPLGVLGDIVTELRRLNVTLEESRPL